MSRITSFCALATAAAALVLASAAAAGAATPGNPQVLRLAPGASGPPAVLAGGSPWTSLYGTDLGPDGTLYVANWGPLGPNPVGQGLYSLASASTAPAPSVFSSFSSGGVNAYPQDVVATPSTVYEIDSGGVTSINPASPSTRTTVTSGGLLESLGVDAQAGAISGTTLYLTADSSCQSAEGGGAYVLAVDLTTGTQTQVASLSCAALGGIVVEAAGTLLVAETTSNTNGGGKPALVRVNPANGQVTPLPTGGTALLKAPQGLALAGTTLYVADAQAGILSVNTTTGRQSAVSTPNSKSPLGNAFGIAVGPDGTLYVSEAGVPPTLTASVPSRQKVRSSGVAVTARCNRACSVAYTLTVNTVPSYAQGGTFSATTTSKSHPIKVGSSILKRIRSALKRGRPVTAKVQLTPQDPNSGSAGRTVSFKVRFVS